MNITDFINLARQAPELRLVVIGSYAAAAHGYQRAVFHIDFLAREEDRDAWITKLLAAGLRKVSEASVFAQFSQEDGEGFDLMFVNRETFEQMWRDSFEQRFDEHVARAPHVDHLLALKLYALKQKVAHRTRKDATDIEEWSDRATVSMEVMIQRNADFRRWFPQSIPTEEERLASKVHAEFVL